MLYQEWSNILEKISHDPSLSGANVIEKIKKELQSYPEAYREWKKADPKKFKATLLCFAAGGGHIEVVKALLDAEGIDVRAANTDGWTALHCAVVGGHMDIAELLLKKGADIDAKTNNGAWTTLSLIIFLNDEKCEEKVKFLLERGASVNAVNCNGKAPLHLAIENGNLNVVKALLKEEKINVNIVSNFGEAPLHFAAAKGNVEVVTHLFERGADVKAADQHGKTPLHRAAHEGHIKVVEALLKKGVDVNAADEDGKFPLHYAAQEGHIEIVEALLKKGAGVDVVDKYGKTPLHRAAHEGHIKVVEALLEKGANPIKVLNSHLYKAKHVNPEIKQLLKKAKKEINRSASDLFGAVLTNEKEEAESIMKSSKQEGRLAAMLESGSWMQCLFISKEQAKELAKKDNKDIIREIQTRQAIGLGIVGGVMAVFAIVAIATIILTASTPMTVGATLGIVAAGVLGCTGLLGIGFACYHVPKEPPSPTMEEVGKKEHALSPTQSTTPGVPNP